MTEKGQQRGDLVHLYDSESSAACSLILYIMGKNK